MLGGAFGKALQKHSAEDALEEQGCKRTAYQTHLKPSSFAAFNRMCSLEGSSAAGLDLPGNFQDLLCSVGQEAFQTLHRHAAALERPDLLALLQEQRAAHHVARYKERQGPIVLLLISHRPCSGHLENGWLPVPLSLHHSVPVCVELGSRTECLQASLRKGRIHFGVVSVAQVDVLLTKCLGWLQLQLMSDYERRWLESHLHCMSLPKPQRLYRAHPGPSGGGSFKTVNNYGSGCVSFSLCFHPVSLCLSHPLSVSLSLSCVLFVLVRKSLLGADRPPESPQGPAREVTNSS